MLRVKSKLQSAIFLGALGPLLSQCGVKLPPNADRQDPGPLDGYAATPVADAAAPSAQNSPQAPTSEAATASTVGKPVATPATGSAKVRAGKSP